MHTHEFDTEIKPIMSRFFDKYRDTLISIVDISNNTHRIWNCLRYNNQVYRLFINTFLNRII